MRKGIRLFLREPITKKKGIVMKTIFALAAAALTVGTAFAQDDSSWLNIAPQEQKAAEGQRHMVEFNADSIPTIIYSIERSKTKGTDSDNDSSSNITLNYAYTIHPNVQVGGRFSFFNGIFANNDVERLNIQVGGWFNTKAGDLQNSPYIAAHVGTGYSQTFGDAGGRDDLWSGQIALGKRFSLEDWGVQAVSWTPEVAFVSENSTNNSNFDYRQAMEFRVLQFSILW